MTITTGFSDAVPGGDATAPKTGDLTGAISSGSTDAILLITNTGDMPCNLYWRKTGTVPYYLLSINPQVSVDQWISLTSARTFEYYFDASTLQVDVAYFFGTGLSSPVLLSDVEAWLTMHGYTISASGDMTSAQVQLCLDDITAEVTMAATRYGLIANQTLSAAFKNHVILKGSIAQALYALRGKSAAHGLQAQAVRVDSATADTYMGTYKGYIERLMSGIFYGA